MVKTKEDNNLGNCSICHLAVRHIDDYVKVEEYIKGKLKSHSFFHRSCFRNKISSINDMVGLQDIVKNLAVRTDKMFKEVGI